MNCHTPTSAWCLVSQRIPRQNAATGPSAGLAICGSNYFQKNDPQISQMNRNVALSKSAQSVDVSLDGHGSWHERIRVAAWPGRSIAPGFSEPIRGGGESGGRAERLVPAPSALGYAAAGASGDVPAFGPAAVA